MAGLTLGLDIGANSIGWALIDENGNAIHSMGVRVFPEGVDRETSGTEISKNAQRRMARALRRQIRRRAERKLRLRRELVAANLLPEISLRNAADPERVPWESEQFKLADPYALRARALTERLEPFEIGRLLVHLNQRRGFLSNRKADRANKKENSEILAEISDLSRKLEGRTLGEYLANLRGSDPQRMHLTAVRRLHTHRSMFEDEFERVWSAQQKFHPHLLTDDLKDRLHQTIFFQRPIQPPSAGLIGRCELEPRLPRCPRADRRAQRFRLHQEVNNLRVIDMSAGAERPLTAAEREKLLAYLRPAKERTFDQIRKHLFEQHESILFNLERGGRTKLQGLPTDALLAGKGLLGPAWKKVPEEQKDRIVSALVDEDESRLRVALREADFDDAQAERLLDSVELEQGYSSYSRHALKRLLPHVEAGLPLTSRDSSTPCALREAGYLMPWEHQAERQPFLPEPPNVTNPLVRQALYEVRKVVNAILRELVYRPGHELKHVRLELAREVRGTAQQRQERTREMRKREAQRRDAADRIIEAGHRPTRDRVDSYLLWKEQEGICIYSGRPISQAQLFGGEVAVDHVLPYQRSLDNSLMNKVLCFHRENQAKGDRSPHEWLGGDAERYEELLQRAKLLPYPKLKRFYQQSLELDDFFARQFVDTTYITTQVFDYLRCLGADILCPKGQHTAELRHLWGLGTVLQDLADSPAWRAALELPAGEKNRLDHRHHAVDALVIALTDHRRIRELARVRRFGAVPDRELEGYKPWPGFRDDADAMLRAINVSYRVRRKASGPLHEDTIYGPTSKEGEVVVRKNLTVLTCSMVPDIRDPVVRNKVIERLAEHGIVPGRGQDKIPVEVWKDPLWMNEAKGVPILRVRLIRREKTVRPIRGGKAYVKPGNTHHVCIFEVLDEGGKARKELVFVSMLEAVDRIRKKQPVVNRVHPEYPDGKLLLTLSGNELVLLSHNGEAGLYRFETAASTSGQMWFRHHTAGGKSGQKIGQVSKRAGTISAQKVTVDPIGRIRRAGD